MSSPASRPEPAAWRPLAGLRVLLAEDARGTRRLYEAGLVRAGAEVSTAGDGGEAVRAWRRAAESGSPFDAAVLDYMMPEMNGAAVSAALREADFRGVIIGISAELPEPEAQAWLAAGCDEVLAKGISLEGLVARVAAARRRPRDPENRPADVPDRPR